MEISSTNPSPYILIGVILTMLFGSVAYGMYNSFGSGAHRLTDSIDEHARMHELGIAHTHGDK
ncbi:photosystem II reaction center protein PsbN [Prochlorococcus sp. MIT 0603]|uniref:photosystem II reaction center protein PsbN n=1 Tax=unclassified Prochlorococcus TaxID=2627481 RepID=UPI00055F9A9E